MIINSEKAVEQRNAERHCTDAGGKWNKTNKTCVGANCGADMKWDDNKNTCIYTDPSRYEKGIVTSETEAATDDKTEMTGERVGDAGVVNTQENVAEQKCADVGGVWNVETKKCDNPQCPGVEEWDDEKYKCVKKNAECTEEETKGMLNASLIKRDKENGKCFIQKCACGYDLVNGECIEWQDKSCTSTTNPPVPEHAKTALMKCDGKKAYCHVMDCEGDYKPNDNNKKCVPIKCTEDALAELKARTGSFENGKCVPKTCIKDWHLVDGECMGPATYSAKKRCEKVGGTWADDECNNPQCDADKRWVGGVLNHCICKSGKENKKGVCVKAEEDILEGGGLDGGVSAVSADDLSIPTDEVRRSGASVIESESSTGPVQKSAAQQGCENTGGRWNDTNNDCTCSGVGKIWYSEWNECSCDRTKYMTDSDGGCLTLEEYEKEKKDNVANNYVKMDDWKIVVQGNQGIVYLKKDFAELINVFVNACGKFGGKVIKDDKPERVSSLHEWVDRGFNYGAEIKYQCEVTADDVMKKFDAEISKNPVLAKAKDEYPDRYPQVLLYFLDDLDGAGNPYAVLILNVQIGFD